MISKFDSEAEFGDFLSQHFSPSKEIDRPEKLLGREKALSAVRRAFCSPGRQVFIYGDRGVGKTSLATTAAYLENSSEHLPIIVSCSDENSFARCMISVFKQANAERLGASDIIETKSRRLAIPNSGTFDEATESITYEEPVINDANDAVLAIKRLAKERRGRTVIVLDEMEKVRCEKEKSRFADFLKAISTIDEDVKLIYVGIGQTVDDLIGHHPSAGRYFEPVELERLNHNNLWTIISGAADDIGVEVQNTQLQRVGIISDGFPHYVHLIGECLFWELFDSEREVKGVSDDVFSNAIRRSVRKSEPTMSQAYRLATEKTKNTKDYEHALWALADTSESRRQMTDIFERSYLPMMRTLREDGLAKDTLNQRFLRLRDEKHGRVIVGHGAGWFSFRENVFRGYVRLRAFDSGVELRNQE